MSSSSIKSKQVTSFLKVSSWRNRRVWEHLGLYQHYC